MLFYCWSTVVDGGPVFKQDWFNVSCLLGTALKIGSAEDNLSWALIPQPLNI